MLSQRSLTQKVFTKQSSRTGNTNLQREKLAQWLPLRAEVVAMKRVERISWNHGNILHLGLGYTDVYIYKDSSNHTLRFVQFTV